MNFQALADKSAISLSLLCAIHCLALPLITVLLPMSTGLFLAEEAFHQWLAIVVIPFSVFALYLGCKHHKRTQLLCLGLTGVGVLLVCAAFGHDLFGETGEKIVTVFGACIIAVAHVRNYLLCRDHRDCDCISSQT